MKIAVICDTHHGARGDKIALLNHQTKFLENVFFPTLEERGIKTVWHLGDLVDRRKFINFKTLEVLRTTFLEPLSKYDSHIIMGNHDMYFKNVVSPNSLEELLGEFDINTYCRPTEVGDICVIPWIVDETRQEAYDLIKQSKKKFCFGHLQIKSFEMERGHFCDDGDDIDMFKNFDLTLSGHFHHKSMYNNICYLGNPFEMTWRDYKDNRGFHILDTKTMELEHIPNPYRLFHKFVYDDNYDNPKDATTSLLGMIEEAGDIEEAFIKVVVKNKTNNYTFDVFIDKLISKSIADLQIVDDHFNLNIEPDEVILEQAEDTLTILNKYIESIDINCDSVALKQLLKELYDEAAFLRLS